MSMGSTLERDKVENLEEEMTDEGEHDRFSHYVRKEDIIRATFDNVPVTAICGKVWVANKSPEKYPVCATCKEIYEGIPQGD
jgi:rubrerythrin